MARRGPAGAAAAASSRRRERARAAAAGRSRRVAPARAAAAAHTRRAGRAAGVAAARTAAERAAEARAAAREEERAAAARAAAATEAAGSVAGTAAAERAEPAEAARAARRAEAKPAAPATPVQRTSSAAQASSAFRRRTRLRSAHGGRLTRVRSDGEEHAGEHGLPAGRRSARRRFCTAVGDRVRAGARATPRATRTVGSPSRKSARQELTFRAGVRRRGRGEPRRKICGEGARRMVVVAIGVRSGGRRGRGAKRAAALAQRPPKTLWLAARRWNSYTMNSYC